MKWGKFILDKEILQVGWFGVAEKDPFL